MTTTELLAGRPIGWLTTKELEEQSGISDSRISRIAELTGIPRHFVQGLRSPGKRRAAVMTRVFSPIEAEAIIANQDMAPKRGAHRELAPVPDLTETVATVLAELAAIRSYLEGIDRELAALRRAWQGA